MSSFMIGWVWKRQLTNKTFCGQPVYCCRKDLEASTPNNFVLNKPGMPYVGQGQLFMYSENRDGRGPWLVIQAHDWNPKELQPFWKCNADLAPGRSDLAPGRSDLAPGRFNRCRRS